MIPALSGPSNSLFSDLRALGALGALCVLCVKSLSLLLPVNCELSTVNFLSGSNHENQKNQRRTSLETTRRPSRSPAAPVHHGPRRLFSPPAAQPSRRQGPAPLLHGLARPRCSPLHQPRPLGRAPSDRPRRFAPGRTQQSRPRGRGAAAQRNSCLPPPEDRPPRRPAPPSGHRLRAGLPEDQGSAPRHPCAGTRTLFLLPAPAYAPDSLPRSRCAARVLREQFLSQPRLLLFALQLAEKRSLRRRFSPLALSRASLDCRRTHRPPPRPRRSRLRQAPASPAVSPCSGGSLDPRFLFHGAACCARKASGQLENRN